MGLRDKINKSPGIGAGVGLVVLVIAGLILYRQFVPPSSRIGEVYYFDLGNNQLFAVKANLIPPIPAPSDPKNQAVRAYVFACGDCGNKREVSYLEMYTPKAKAALEATSAAPPSLGSGVTDTSQTIRKGHLVRGKDQKEWVQVDAPEAASVYSSASTKCGDSAKITVCEPAQ